MKIFKVCANIKNFIYFNDKLLVYGNLWKLILWHRVMKLHIYIVVHDIGHRGIEDIPIKTSCYQNNGTSLNITLSVIKECVRYFGNSCRYEENFTLSSRSSVKTEKHQCSGLQNTACQSKKMCTCLYCKHTLKWQIYGILEKCTLSYWQHSTHAHTSTHPHISMSPVHVQCPCPDTLGH